MLLVVIIAVAALVIVAASAFVITRNRREIELEPPAEPRLERPGAGTAVAEPEAPAELAPEPEAPELEVPVKPSFRERLGKARSNLGGFLGSALGRPAVDAEAWDELEEALILADMGVGPATEIIGAVREQAAAAKVDQPEQVLGLIKSEVATRLGGHDRSLNSDAGEGTAVWLFVGVNGVGKTTTIGKIAARETAEGASIVMAAGDTFRAAAAEQLTMWAERAGTDIVRGAEGADPSSVVFDAIESATAKGADLVLADTAGRLHTKTNLMEELSKVRRVAEKGAGVVTETLLVIDATTGQNGLIQAQQFTEAVEVTGIVLTKLDGSAKGGIVLAIQRELGIPIKLVGLGEGIGDLVEFDAEEFVDAIFDA